MDEPAKSRKGDTGSELQRVMELLDAALDLPAPQQEAFLAQACDDDKIREKVRALLTAERDPHFLDAPLFDVHEQDGVIGQLVGPYRLEETLGRGGMGTVFLATRQDGFHQRVALKLIKRGMDTDEIVRRFRQERQILAGLEHPYIAKLLDGGSTSDGLPYFAMELVEGQPIDQFCDDRRLRTQQRIELFLRVCSAVQFAHRNLIVHRDLKPGNILVDDSGQPKLLDFGIAKLLQSRPHLQTFATAAQRQPLTFDYASPEQVKGEPITTASDVYALGVLLYFLLSGHLPYRLNAQTDVEIARTICDVEPRRPSTAVQKIEKIKHANGAVWRVVKPEDVSARRGEEPRKLSRRLSGDLDSIVLTALRKEPQRRYDSVEQLADDLHRYLAGLPVKARGSAWRYRSGKFLHRHRWSLATAAAFLLLLGVFILTLSQQRDRAEHERDRAEDALVQARNARDSADQLSTVLVETLVALKPSIPKEQDAQEIKTALDRAADKIDSLPWQDVEAHTRLIDQLGRTYRSLGFYDEAAKFLDRALELRHEHLGEHHLLTAESLHNRAFLYQETNDFPAAEPLLRRSIDIKLQQMPGDDPRLAENLNNLAIVLYQREASSEAEELFRRVLALRRREHSDDHPNVLRVLNNLASVLTQQGKHQEAYEIYRQSLAIRLTRLGPDHEAVALSRNQLASSLYEVEQYEQAERELQEALRIRRLVYGPVHLKVARVLVNLGKALQAREKHRRAEAAYREALAIQIETLGENEPAAARTRQFLAEILLATDRFPQAEAMARQALTSWLGSAIPADPWRLAETRSVLGECLLRQGRFAEAEPLLATSYETLLAERGNEDDRTRKAHRRLEDLRAGRTRPDRP